MNSYRENLLNILGDDRRMLLLFRHQQKIRNTDITRRVTEPWLNYQFKAFR